MDSAIIHTLQEALDRFGPTNANFVIDLFVNNECVFQLIHPSIASQNKLSADENTDFVFVFYLVFSTGSPDDSERLEKFRTMPIWGQFATDTWNDITSYTYNLGTNITEVTRLILFFLTHLYGITENDHFEIAINNSY